MNCQVTLGCGILVGVELSLSELNSALFPAFGDDLKEMGPCLFFPFLSVKAERVFILQIFLRELFSRYFIHENSDLVSIVFPGRLSGQLEN